MKDQRIERRLKAASRRIKKEKVGLAMKLDTDLHEKLKKICEYSGTTIQEAVSYLIQDEWRRFEDSLDGYNITEEQFSNNPYTEEDEDKPEHEQGYIYCIGEGVLQGSGKQR